MPLANRIFFHGRYDKVGIVLSCGVQDALDSFSGFRAEIAQSYRDQCLLLAFPSIIRALP